MSQTATKSIALSAEEAKEHLSKLQGWDLAADAKAINKEYKFKNFVEALAFVNRLGEAAEEANHHPDLTLGWGYAGVTYTTHDAGGLRPNDFAMAEKTDAIYQA